MQKQRGKRRSNQHALRLYNLYIGGLLALVLVVLQAVLGVDKPDIWITTCVIAFAAALPLLGGMLVVNLLEEIYPYGPVQSVNARLLNLCFIAGAIATFIGMITVFWHISWLAVVMFVMVMTGVSIICMCYISELEKQPEKPDEDK